MMMNEPKKIEKAPMGLWFLGLAVSTFIFAYPLTRLGNPDGANWGALNQMNAEGKALDIAIVGDSHAHTGLSPKVMAERLREKGFPETRIHNFSIDGTDAIHHSYFIRHGLLAQTTPPKVIVYVPNALQFNARRLNNRLEQLSSKMIPDLKKAGAPLELQLDVLSMSFFKPYRYRPLAMKKVSEKVEIFGKKTLPVQTRLMGLTYHEEPVSRKYLPEPDGFEPFEVLEFKDRFDRGAKAYIQDYKGLEVSEWHFRLIRDSLSEARAKGVQVIVIEPPISNWFRDHLMTSEKYQTWKNRIEKETASPEGAVVYDMATYFNGPDSEYFGDPSHMSRSSALLFSKAIADLIAREPAVRGKWNLNASQESGEADAL